MQFDFNKKITKAKIREFADILMRMQERIDFRVSSRGWCYLMEQAGYINKSQFNKVDLAINRCRKEGLLPVDFVAEEDARAFSNVEIPNVFRDEWDDKREISGILEWMLRDVLNGDRYYTPDWWDGEECYIQMLVEKIDLKTLFEPICAEYHIPIANAKGWSSILQRAEYARRFKEAEDRGLKCVLLYCGDHDPDGLRISDTIRNNLQQVSEINWKDGEVGYNPINLEIHRFGLNYDFIIKNKYTWIDNLITGSGGELAVKLPDGRIVAGKAASGASHKNFKLQYLQDYIKTIGVRKCEANAIVTTPQKAKDLVREEIENWLGKEAINRFRDKRNAVRAEYLELLEESGLQTPIENFLNRK